jgi:hypothetical protein
MSDARVAHTAGRQFNRISRAQLCDLGMSDRAIAHRVTSGRFVVVEEGVYAIAPVLRHDSWGRWMGATLTSPGSMLSHRAAASARQVLADRSGAITVTRPGSGGPVRHGNVVVHRSLTLHGDEDVLHGIPITTVERMLLDLAATEGPRVLARAVRESLRLRLTTIPSTVDRLRAARGRRGSRRLAEALARYAGLPVERARAGSEVRALEILRDAGRPAPLLNALVAGLEADLSWPSHRLIIEIDGGPFHLDRGADAERTARWTSMGWTVRRIDADDVYERPQLLLALAPPPPNLAQ